MSKYILVMKSGYEQKVECDDRTFILQWEHTISNDNGGIVFNFNNGLMVNLLDVAMIKPYRDDSRLTPFSPTPNIKVHSYATTDLGGFEPRKESRY